MITLKDLWEQFEYTAASFHESQEQQHNHDGNRGETFKTCFNATCRKNYDMLGDKWDDLYLRFNIMDLL